jgi:hypothetical protein
MGFSAAGLQSLVNEAALLAARQRALCVGPEHFAEGIERVVRSTKSGEMTQPMGRPPPPQFAIIGVLVAYVRPIIPFALTRVDILRHFTQLHRWAASSGLA